MTASTHVYSAVLVGTPDVALSLKGGSITLDSTVAPHVQSSVTISRPSSATLAALDPRAGARVKVTAAGTYPSFSKTRTFNLGLRRRPVPLGAAEVQLTLASDEALLDDAAPLADDETPWSLQASLRSIVNYALGKIGASLAASPAVDADLTSYWAVTNLVANPAGRTGTAPWVAAGNCTIFQSTGWSPVTPIGGTTGIGFTSSAAGLLAVDTTAIGSNYSVTAGQLYTISAWGRMNGATARTFIPTIRFLDAQGNARWGDTAATPVNLSSTAWVRASLTARAPAGAVQARAFYRVAGSTAAGQIGYITGAMFHQGRLVDYFDGATAATAKYTFSWGSTADASASTRTPLVDSPQPDAFIMQAGQSLLDFLHPLVQVAGYRLVCDESRTWTLRSESYDPGGSLAFLEGVNIVDATDTLDRDDDTWFDAAVTRYTWLDGAGVQQVAIDSYALTGTPTQVRTFEKRTPYPGPGFSQYAVRRAQGRGRTVEATQVADWRAVCEQFVQITLTGAPILTGTVESVTFSLDNDEMTVTTRTVDTPAAAWVLIPIGQKWLDSPVGGTWTGEVI